MVVVMRSSSSSSRRTRHLDGEAREQRAVRRRVVALDVDPVEDAGEAAPRRGVPERRLHPRACSAAAASAAVVRQHFLGIGGRDSRRGVREGHPGPQEQGVGPAVEAPGPFPVEDGVGDPAGGLWARGIPGESSCG